MVCLDIKYGPRTIVLECDDIYCKRVQENETAVYFFDTKLVDILPMLFNKDIPKTYEPVYYFPDGYIPDNLIPILLPDLTVSYHYIGWPRSGGLFTIPFFLDQRPNNLYYYLINCVKDNIDGNNVEFSVDWTIGNVRFHVASGTIRDDYLTMTRNNIRRFIRCASNSYI